MVKPLKYALLFLLLLPCLMFSACSGSHSKKPEIQPGKAMNYYLQAAQSIEVGKFAEAKSLVDSALTYRPDFAVFHQTRGWLLARLDQPDSAIASYKRSLGYKSHAPNIWGALGIQFLKIASYEEASYWLEKAVAAFPDSSDLYLQLTDSYYRRGNYTRTLSIIDAYQRRFTSPHPPILYKLRGISFFAEEQYAAARAELQYYCDLKFNDGEGWKYLGMAAFHLGDSEAAVSALNKAQPRLPGDSEIFLYRARYFRGADKHDIAMEQVEIGLQKNPDNAELLTEKGILLFEARQLESAERILKSVLENREDAWIAYRYLGFIAEAKKQPEEAIDYFSVYIKNAARVDKEVQTRMEALEAGNGR
ncbi:MAG: tetratricopeptide repeat protein [Calditrichota bacterium]